MINTRLFSLIKSIECSLQSQYVIDAYKKKLTHNYHELKVDPLIYANGSVPREAIVSLYLVPNKRIKIEFYQVVQTATSAQILSYLVGRKAIHLGGLGLMLIGRYLPPRISFIAFEDNDYNRMTSYRRGNDGTFKFMILKHGISWDNSDGFVCITEVPDDE